MPEKIPVLDRKELQRLSGLEYPQIAFEITNKFLADEIPREKLTEIIHQVYTFEVPLERVDHEKYIMRLDRGPTASFKDFAARMMGRLMQYYLNREQRKMLILTATSGDTGSAIANAFYGLENIKVVVLFPEREVSSRQRKQMTTLGKNIDILALDATFDDCQALVKQAFSDPDLFSLNLSSANSINIGRLLPQSIYYFYAYAQLVGSDQEQVPVFSVPCGNFGDLMGGLIAVKMGLPVKRFIVATNENDEVPRFFATGKYQKIVPSKNCISSAMNVGHPSNLARIVDLYGGMMDQTGTIHQMPDLTAIRKQMYAVSINDRQTGETIQAAYRDHHALLEPHGAVAWAGLQNYLTNHPKAHTPHQVFVSLETAHPAKFPEKIRELLNFDPELPESLEGIEDKPEFFQTIGKSYAEFKSYLKDTYLQAE